MLLHSLSFQPGGHCSLSLAPADTCLCVTWSGYISPDDAMSGAEQYLAQARRFHAPCLLNDNAQLRGPWFESLQWLDRVWLPQAIQLGLRYIAHVVPAANQDILTRTFAVPITDVFELQLFDDIASAWEWLQDCQQPLPPTVRPDLPLQMN